MTTRSLCETAGDQRLVDQIEALEAQLYGTPSTPTDTAWSAAELGAGVTRARRRLEVEHHASASATESKAASRSRDEDWSNLRQIACLVVAARASAQSISPAEYLPLGDGAQWQFDRVAGSGPSDLHLEVTDVDVTDTGTRYLIDVPLEGAEAGLRLEFAPDGSLYLRAVQANLNELLDGLPLDPSATADVQFSPRVLLGNATLVPGSAAVQTPIDEVFDADLETNIGSVDLDVHATGSIGASWDPTTSPTETPAGSFPDVVALTLDVSLTFFEDVFGSQSTRTRSSSTSRRRRAAPPTSRSRR